MGGVLARLTQDFAPAAGQRHASQPSPHHTPEVGVLRDHITALEADLWSFSQVIVPSFLLACRPHFQTRSGEALERVMTNLLYGRILVTYLSI